MEKFCHAAEFFKFVFIFENNKIDGKTTNGYGLLWSNDFRNLKDCVYHFTNTNQMLEFNNLLVDLLEKWILNKNIYHYSWVNQLDLHSQIQKIYNSLGVF